MAAFCFTVDNIVCVFKVAAEGIVKVFFAVRTLLLIAKKPVFNKLYEYENYSCK